MGNRLAKIAWMGLILSGIIHAEEIGKQISRSEILDGAKVDEPRKQNPDFGNWPSPTGPLFRIEALIYEFDPALGEITPAAALKEVAAGNANLIAMPTLVAHEGSWSSFESMLQLTVPTTYDPPLIPRSLAGKVTGGGGLGGKTPVIASVPTVLPPFPRDFETREIGLRIKFRPVVKADGSVSVECDLNRSGLKGFVDHGMPITMAKTTRFGGKGKIVNLMENHQMVPEIQTQTESLSFPGSRMVDPVFAKSKITREGFAASLSRPDLPPLLVTVTAKKIAEPETPVNPPPKDAQIYLTVKALEFTWEKGTPFSLPVISESIFTDLEFQMEIRRLSSLKSVDLVAVPSVVTRDSQQARMEVGREFIYPTVYNPPTINERGASSAPVEFPVSPATPTSFNIEQIGVRLDVLPKIRSGNLIELKVKSGTTEFSQFLNFGEQFETGANGPEHPVQLSENRIYMPVFQKSGIETTVRIPDGRTICVGGMMTDAVQQIEDKFPLLGDLPLIGGAFTKMEERKMKKVVYFFIRAQLIDPAGIPIEKPK